MKKQRPTTQGDRPTLLTDTAPAQSLIVAAHPLPATHTDDPERPASIPPDVWRFLRRYSHLIAVDKRKLRGLLAQAPDDALVTAAFAMASQQRPLKGVLLHHSDRGSQYTSRGYRHLLQTKGIQVSMSRRANCWDNAAIESFWKTLKTECTDCTHFLTQQQARTTIFEYVEVFYNRQRLHSTLGYLSIHCGNERRPFALGGRALAGSWRRLA